jgi:RNA polymerase sigma-70 factor (ECF subfamily)
LVPFTNPEASLPAPFLGTESRQRDGLSPLELEVVQFFEELRQPLLRYTVAIGLRVDDGEEIVQDVFLALFRHLKQGKPRTNLKGWVFRVGHNLALKRRLRNLRRNRIECAAGAAAEQTDPNLDPEEKLAEVQRRRRLLTLMETLPEVDRCCLYLRAEGLRYREIAEVLGISLGGVSLALARSLARLGEADRKQHE